MIRPLLAIVVEVTTSPLDTTTEPNAHLLQLNLNDMPSNPESVSITTNVHTDDRVTRIAPTLAHVLPQPRADGKAGPLPPPGTSTPTPPG